MREKEGYWREYGMIGKLQSEQYWLGSCLLRLFSNNSRSWLGQQSSAFDRRCLFNKVMTKWKSATINQQVRLYTLPLAIYANFHPGTRP